MIYQKESKKVRMSFWLLKLLSKDIKAQKTKINQQTFIKNKRKKNNNKKYNTYHGQPSQIWIDGRYQSLI